MQWPVAVEEYTTCIDTPVSPSLLITGLKEPNALRFVTYAL
jgi:hypothetical protein